MRGLAKGTASSATNPVLQLIGRSGGLLADIYSGSYQIDEIYDHAQAAVNKVPSTAIDTTNDKLGTGRYVLATGDTSAWTVGTHRATVTYKMEDGGPDYKQFIDFEILTAVDWPDDQSFCTYISSRDIFRGSYIATGTARSTVHLLLHEAAQRLEQWTGRWFEPRYTRLKKGGQSSPKLLLQSPIIAIEDVYAVWKTTTGSDSYKYESYLYKVYNRHLDGFQEEDDRRHPYLELTQVDGTVVRVNGWTWPYGSQNVEVRGVFGYTEPAFDPHFGQVNIGTTPRDLARVAGVLASRTFSDPTFASSTTWSSAQVKSMKTRHQTITYDNATSGSSASGLGPNGSWPTGDVYLDNIIIKYCQPWGVGGL